MSVLYKVILAYDGTAFAGMQRQADARTVQGEVENALRRIGWEGRSLLAAGRTDAGVHASGQVISFHHDWQHGPEKLCQALNASLPPDIAAQQVFEVGEDFHPRFDAAARTYRYTILCSPVRVPLRERYAWRVWPRPDVELLNACAAELIGVHDFAAFGSPHKPGGPTTREVFAAGWQAEQDEISNQNELIFTVTANAFLYHMVRRMVSSQVAVGRAKRSLEAFRRDVSSPQEMIQGLAPAHGLCLVEVTYRDEPQD
ncbi:MAG TPA: tRNA pseudouridine(38-40) synthase TruA [Anaerolineales bacterium]|nr:tRNA pseudouridine(38-40) synthase TruA [Anaerolineales bacterium]